MELFAEDNPIPSVDDLDLAYLGSPDYLATLEQRSSEMTQVETKPEKKVEQPYRRVVPALAVVAAAVLIGVVAILSQTDETAPVATQPGPSLSEPVDADRAMILASEYIGAWFAGDDATSLGLTAGDELPGFFDSTRFEEIPGEVAFWDAAGWSLEMGECRVTNSTPDLAWIGCGYTLTTSVSEALGAAPFTGEYQVAVQHVGDGLAVTNGNLFRVEGTRFVAEVWEPFERWLETNHPADADKMFDDTYVTEFLTRPAFTSESIELWRQHTAEFIAEQGQN
jgi:hypothetical protein